MKNMDMTAFIAAALVVAVTACGRNREESLRTMIDRCYDTALSQSMMLAESTSPLEGTLPRTFEDGELKTTDYRGWVCGFTITGGAIASTVGHDSHNVCVVGDNPTDMRLAVEHVGQGGFVLVRDGKLVAKLDLPLAGLMSDRPADEVAAEHDAFVRAGRAAGIEPPLDSVMGMIFLPLPVIPEVRIRPEGLFDTVSYTYVS